MGKDSLKIFILLNLIVGCKTKFLNIPDRQRNVKYFHVIFKTDDDI